ncbi:MAG: hypothetical protein CML22_07000 [Rheinheimera sp.]|nr:hypothetical protein [Rheinheimera sp.]MBM34031.1 hypothetical protein [Rheinheimera sp.]|tara:strand:+ start:426 stop:656 length:231 start_codon:yes stop_codon:yes gene_type:complete
MYQIRNGRERLNVDTVDLLVRKLSEINGSVSIILMKPSGMTAASYVDVSNGVIRQSYGARMALKASDFALNGAAFQ